jgi:hypothetical protein
MKRGRAAGPPGGYLVAPDGAGSALLEPAGALCHSRGDFDGTRGGYLYAAALCFPLLSLRCMRLGDGGGPPSASRATSTGTVLPTSPSVSRTKTAGWWRTRAPSTSSTVAPAVSPQPGTSCRVRMRGLEPPRACAHTDLNRARLPIPPHPRGGRIVAGVSAWSGRRARRSRAGSRGRARRCGRSRHARAPRARPG